jgi:oxaloacetate decarboxylase beta subunit
LINIVTIFLGVTVGATAVGAEFLKPQTLTIIAIGLVAFMFSTVGGLLIGKIMCWVTKGKINPLIGSAGVSAVPMAARISQIEGQKANPANYLLMHAIGPNVAGVIGSAVAAGILLSLFG